MYIVATISQQNKYEQECFISFRFLRGVAYREFTQLVHGILGGERIPLPACAYRAIRNAFSGDAGEYVGFEDNEWGVVDLCNLFQAITKSNYKN